MTNNPKPRFLVQQTDTGFFFKHPGEWVPERTHATGFESSATALETSLNLGLQRVHFVMDFGDPRYDAQIEGW